MRTTRRPAALLLAAFVLSGCGTAAPDAAPEVAGGESLDPAPTPRVCVDEPTPPAEVTEDMPPHYVENHAFQRRMRLCDEDLQRTRAVAKMTRRGIERRDAVTVSEVERALLDLGHEPGSVTVAAEGGLVRFTVLVSPGCVDGDLGPEGLRVEARGLYAEGGCIKPVGGH